MSSPGEMTVVLDGHTYTTEELVQAIMVADNESQGNTPVLAKLDEVIELVGGVRRDVNGIPTPELPEYPDLTDINSKLDELLGASGEPASLTDIIDKLDVLTAQVAAIKMKTDHLPTTWTIN